MNGTPRLAIRSQDQGLGPGLVLAIFIIADVVLFVSLFLMRFLIAREDSAAASALAIGVVVSLTIVTIYLSLSRSGGEGTTHELNWWKLARFLAATAILLLVVAVVDTFRTFSVLSAFSLVFVAIAAAIGIHMVLGLAAIHLEIRAQALGSGTSVGGSATRFWALILAIWLPTFVVLFVI